VGVGGGGSVGGSVGVGGGGSVGGGGDVDTPTFMIDIGNTPDTIYNLIHKFPENDDTRKIKLLLKVLNTNNLNIFKDTYLRQGSSIGYESEARDSNVSDPATQPEVTTSSYQTSSYPASLVGSPPRPARPLGNQSIFTPRTISGSPNKRLVSVTNTIQKMYRGNIPLNQGPPRSNSFGTGMI
jgi:hypothetical protein